MCSHPETWNPQVQFCHAGAFIIFAFIENVRNDWYMDTITVAGCTVLIFLIVDPSARIQEHGTGVQVSLGCLHSRHFRLPAKCVRNGHRGATVPPD